MKQKIQNVVRLNIYEFVISPILNVIIRHPNFIYIILQLIMYNYLSLHQLKFSAFDNVNQCRNNISLI